MENLAGHDVVFLALPHGASAAIAAQLPAGTVVIDAVRTTGWRTRRHGSSSTARRTPDLALRPARTPRPARGLRGAKRIAVPGCYPTSALLALTPGFSNHLLQGDDVVIVSASGTSGPAKPRR